MRLPPYGKQFRTMPKSGIRVVIGGDAWDFAEKHAYPIMVLPEGEDPTSFSWPSRDGPALVYERGEADNRRLRALAEALLLAGSSSVVGLRQSKLGSDPRIFFDPEVADGTT